MGRVSRKQKSTPTPASPPPGPELRVEPPEFSARIGYTVVPQFPPGDPRGVPTPDGAQGVYRVTFTLCIPGKSVFRRHLDLTRVNLEGDSMLAVSSEWVGLEVQLQSAEGHIASINFTPNGDQRLWGASGFLGH